MSVADGARRRAARRRRDPPRRPPSAATSIALRHGSRALTYRALDERSNRLAQALLAAGVGPGSRVAHLDRTGPEVIELLFAASKIGAVLVPLNWRLAVPELTRIVADAAAPLLIAGSAFADAASAIAGALPAPLRTVEVGTGLRAVARRPRPGRPGDRGDSGDTVVQMYTSGTTGVPKGVLTTHRNLAAAAETSPRWGFDADTVSLTPLPMFHIGGIGWAFLGLWNGATHDPGQRVRARSRARRARARARNQRGLRPDDAADARGRAGRRGARLLGAALDRVRRLADHDAGAQGGAAHVPLRAVRHLRPHRDDRRRGRSSTRPTTIRTARASTCCARSAVRIRGSSCGSSIRRRGAPCGPREVGEVWLRAPNVMAGYFNRPDGDGGGAHRRRLAAHRRRRLPRRRRATSS